MKLEAIFSRNTTSVKSSQCFWEDEWPELLQGSLECDKPRQAKLAPSWELRKFTRAKCRVQLLASSKSLLEGRSFYWCCSFIASCLKEMLFWMLTTASLSGKTTISFYSQVLFISFWQWAQVDHSDITMASLRKIHPVLCFFSATRFN